jgi:hypothetical protein
MEGHAHRTVRAGESCVGVRNGDVQRAIEPHNHTGRADGVDLDDRVSPAARAGAEREQLAHDGLLVRRDRIERESLVVTIGLVLRIGDDEYQITVVKR